SLQIVRIIFPARYDAGLARYEFGVHAFRTGYRDGTEDGILPGLGDQGRIDRTRIVRGHDPLIGDVGLGVTLLPPFLDHRSGGAEYHSASGGLPGSEGVSVRILDAVTAIRGGRCAIFNARVGEIELRAGINRNRHMGGAAELLVREQAGSFLAIDGDGNGRAVAAKGIV